MNKHEYNKNFSKKNEFNIVATKYGFATIKAESLEEALEIAKDMDETDFEWADIEIEEINY